ncbi:tRNA 2'-phosphotransferase 1 isoform X2 [Vidua chalybeata]|uniref:tRNA 2'-phosphotransferase 1 isoform X2 n=1 Tax=Vidua chalybeata TaxID=81927 RepID=UPI0023A7965F|nr:tRNA 2'-phosphotransferase 1 isoform X2 [Vidua chalybeata]
MAGGEGASAAQRRRRRKEEDPGVRLSKALSYVLRHGAAAEGLPMGPDGFVEVGALLRLRRFAGVSEGDVRRVVATDPKGRFALRPDPLRVRANQGHSLPPRGAAPHPRPRHPAPPVGPDPGGGAAPHGAATPAPGGGAAGGPRRAQRDEVGLGDRHHHRRPPGAGGRDPLFPLGQRGDPDAGGRPGPDPPQIFPAGSAAAAAPV